MSRPKFYWYAIAKKMVMRYPKYKDGPASQQELLFKEAIETVINDTLKKKNGEVRIKAVKEVLWDKTKTYQGIAQECFYDWRTVQNWITLFINTVGKEAGY